MNKVVINNCYGGFSLSMKALQLLYKKLGKGEYNYPYKYDYEDKLYHKSSLEESDWLLKEDYGDIINDELINKEGICRYDLPVSRHDKTLVEVVEELEEEASGDCAHLKVVQIPGDKYLISEYDGLESIETPESLDWITIS